MFAVPARWMFNHNLYTTNTGKRVLALQALQTFFKKIFQVIKKHPNTHISNSHISHMAILTDYTSYNLWANRVIINWLRSKPSEIMLQETISSYPTLHETILHIWAAEQIWLQRLRQEPTTPFLQYEFKGTSEEAFNGLLQCSTAFDAYVRGITEADLATVISFKLLSGVEDAQPREHMIHHCMNHGSYHRGQIVTMGRALGLTDPPSTDQMRYFREVKAKGL
jgi:uncharacterized damage-inducible protein DinB